MSEVLTHKKPLKHELGKHISDVLISSPADGDVLTFELATLLWKNQPPAWRKIFDETVTSNKTEINVTGIDLESYLPIELYFHVYCSLAGGTSFYIFFNADRTLTNYYTQYLMVNGTSITADRLNNPHLAWLDPSLGYHGAQNTTLIKDAQNKMRWLMKVQNRYDAANLQIIYYSGMHNVAVATLSRIDIVASRTNGIFAGSRLILFGKAA